MAINILICLFQDTSKVCNMAAVPHEVFRYEDNHSNLALCKDMFIEG